MPGRHGENKKKSMAKLYPNVLAGKRVCGSIVIEHQWHSRNGHQPHISCGGMARHQRLLAINMWRWHQRKRRLVKYQLRHRDVTSLWHSGNSLPHSHGNQIKPAISNNSAQHGTRGCEEIASS